MPANYLHGVETITVDVGGKPVQVVKSAVIGIVGCAPIHLIDPAARVIGRPVLILNDRDAARKLGPKTAGFSIPAAVAACQLKVYTPIVVVNVFDPAVHKSSVAAEEIVLGADRTVALAHPGVYNLVVKNQGGNTTYIKDTDYTVAFDADGNTVITGMGATLIAGVNLKVDYDYADPTKVTSNDLIGGVNEAGLRTGMQAWLDARSLYGFGPRILIAPGYSPLATVAAELHVMAGKLRAVDYVDAPAGTDVDTALTGRGPAGTINFNTSSERAMLLCPHLLVGTEVVPYSPYKAALRAWVDIEYGWWWSDSNREIPEITGTEYPISAAINDPDSEANILNEAGITTVFCDFGTGFRTWGNRNASFPTASGIDTFECNIRTSDIIEDSIEFAMLQFMDASPSFALLDAITESVRSFLRTCQQNGAILGGNCWFVRDDNPDTELANGHFTLWYDFLPPGALERLTFKRRYNMDYFKALFGGTQ
jgi:phage tail sheath protein FI